MKYVDDFVHKSCFLLEKRPPEILTLIENFKSWISGIPCLK